jgi:hypothetical protein
MWKLGLWPGNFFSGNICYEFSVFCLCSDTAERLPVSKFSECRTVPVYVEVGVSLTINVLLLKNDLKFKNWQMFFFTYQLLQKCSWEKSRKSSGLRCIEEESEIPRIKLSQVQV